MQFQKLITTYVYFIQMDLTFVCSPLADQTHSNIFLQSILHYKIENDMTCHVIAMLQKIEFQTNFYFLISES